MGSTNVHGYNYGTHIDGANERTAEQVESIIKVVTGHCRACYQWVGDGMCYCDWQTPSDF